MYTDGVQRYGGSKVAEKFDTILLAIGRGGEVDAGRLLGAGKLPTFSQGYVEALEKLDL
jgi:hypothetical protein